MFALPSQGSLPPGWDGIGERRPSPVVSGRLAAAGVGGCRARCWGLVLRGFRGEPGRCLLIGCLMSPPLPPTAANWHSLRALEEWLHGLGLNRSMAIAAVGLVNAS